MPRHISGEILQLIVRVSREARRHIGIAWITGVTQGAISKFLKRMRQTGAPNQRPIGHRQRISTITVTS